MKSPDRTSGASRLGGTRGRLRVGGQVLAAVVLTAAIVALSWRVSSSSAGGHRTSTNRVAAGGTSTGGPQSNFATYGGAITDGASINSLYDFLMGHAGQVVSVNLSITAPTFADLKSEPKVIQLDSNCNLKSPPANCPLVLGRKGVRFAIKNAGVVAGTSVTYTNGVYYLSGIYQISPPTLDAKGYFNASISAVNSGTGAGDDDEPRA